MKRHMDHNYCKGEEPSSKVAKLTDIAMAVSSESSLSESVLPSTSSQAEDIAMAGSSEVSITESVLPSTSSLAEDIAMARSREVSITESVLPSKSSQTEDIAMALSGEVSITESVLPSTSSQTEDIAMALSGEVSITESVLPSTSSQTEDIAVAVRGEVSITESVLPSTSSQAGITVVAPGEGSRFSKTASSPLRKSSVKGPTVTAVKTPKASRKRLFSKISSLTPKCRKIYEEYNKARNQVDFLKRAKRALKFSQNKSFEDMTKNLNPYAKKIICMQINLCKKKKQARRFSDTEKLIALSILKQSPKCYRFLQKIFILPSKSTLNTLVSKLKMDVGVSPLLLEVLKKEVASWDDNKKNCCIIFDEMHITETLSYNHRKDEIEGLVHLQDKQNEFADQALVFMLRGAICKWTQPFAFYFCKGATSPSILKSILKEVVAAVIEVGLSPVATICDQSTTFRKALQELQEKTRREQILADLPTDDTVALCGLNLSVIYDPSHLIKGFRNNFLNKTLEIDGNISKWQDIIDVYLTDCNHAETRLLHKLTDYHVLPDKMKNKQKMKVKTAARVLSSTVSAALSYTAQFSHYANDGKPVSPTMANTAKTVKFFDQLFDSMNGASLHHKETKGKDLRKAVTENSKHHSFWREAIRTLEKIEFKDLSGKKVSVPTLKSCITTLKSLMRLWQIFKGKGFKVMRPRYFNSDPIENFFGQVRAYNFRNIDPDCHSFICTYKSLLITRLIKFHQDSYNCEDDQTDQLLNLAQNLKLLSPSEQSPEESCGSRKEEAQNQSEHPHSAAVNEALNEARRQKIKIHSRAYTAGWVVRKVLEKTPCDECKKKLTSESILPIHNWLSHREYTQVKNKLIYPSEKSVRCFGTVINITNNYLEENAHRQNICKNIIQEIKKQNFDVMCPKHQIDQFVLLVTVFAINNWCNSINRILKGFDVVRLSSQESLPLMQKKALIKYKTKLKNKLL